MPWDTIWKPAIEPFGVNLRSISFGEYARPPPPSHQLLGIIYITNNGKLKIAGIALKRPKMLKKHHKFRQGDKVRNSDVCLFNTIVTPK